MFSTNIEATPILPAHRFPTLVRDKKKNLEGGFCFFPIPEKDQNPRKVVQEEENEKGKA
jgi:hypothetical protein